MGGNVVTRRIKKQSVVSGSSAESENRAMAQGVCEFLWLQRILEELKLLREDKVVLYCDKKVAINIIQNSVQHDQTRHIGIDRHFIKEKLTDGVLSLVYMTFDK